MPQDEDVERVIETEEQGVHVEKHGNGEMEDEIWSLNYSKVKIYSSGWIEAIDPHGESQEGSTPGRRDFYPPESIYSISVYGEDEL
jgi:hypothetical protein